MQGMGCGTSHHTDVKPLVCCTSVRSVAVRWSETEEDGHRIPRAGCVRNDEAPNTDTEIVERASDQAGMHSDEEVT
jgi:hypothetical protein